MLQDGLSPVGDSQTASASGTSTSMHLLLNQEYIKNRCPFESVSATLKLSMDMEMRICGLETLTQEVKSDFHAFKTNFKEGMTKIQLTLNTILQLLQPQASNPHASTAQPTHVQHYSQSQYQYQDQLQGQAPSPDQVQS
ncbi:hypothetical protein YC2023_002823 [Brassica napus]